MQVQNSNGQTALAVAKYQGYFYVAKIIEEFIPIPIEPRKSSTTGLVVPAPTTEEKNKLLFLAYGPKKVEEEDQITLRIYCIDKDDHSLRDTIYGSEKDNTQWAPATICPVPKGENIIVSVHEMSDFISMDPDEKNQQIDADRGEIACLDFDFDVGTLERACNARVALRVTCKEKTMADIVMKRKVEKKGVQCVLISPLHTVLCSHGNLLGYTRVIDKVLPYAYNFRGMYISRTPRT